MLYMRKMLHGELSGAICKLCQMEETLLKVLSDKICRIKEP